jgi:hypothetical protein
LLLPVRSFLQDLDFSGVGTVTFKNKVLQEYYESPEHRKLINGFFLDLKEMRDAADARWAAKFGRPFVDGLDDLADLLAEHGESINCLVDNSSPISKAPMWEVVRLLEVKMEAAKRNLATPPVNQWIGPKEKAEWKTLFRWPDSTWKDKQRNHPEAFKAGTNVRTASIRTDFYEQWIEESKKRPAIKGRRKRRKEPGKDE